MAETSNFGKALAAGRYEKAPGQVSHPRSPNADPVEPRRHLAEKRRPSQSIADAVELDAMKVVEKPLILIAGDDAFVSLLKYLIEQEGFQTIVASDEASIFTRVNLHKPDLIAHVSGRSPEMAVSLFDKIIADPRTQRTPLLMMMSDEVGAAELRQRSTSTRDVLLKPFVPEEIVRRINALMRAHVTATDDILSFIDISMNLRSHRVYRGARKIHLGPVEYRLLQHFLSNPRQVFSRKQLLEIVWGHGIHVVLRTVDVHVGRLRKRLAQGDEPNYIRTVRGAGYSLDSEE